jgi:UDP-3-O-[3-hydroxymyristoyl] glucosamine N-acyltransferase
MVSHSITEPGIYSSGIPLEKATVWRRMVARFKRLDRLEARLKKLESGQPQTQHQEEDDD